MRSEPADPHRKAERERVVDLTGPGQYNLLNESEDERRYQWSWWLPIAVVAVVTAFVVLLLALA